MTKAQLQEVIDTVFAVTEAALRSKPLLRLAVEAVQHVVDGRIDVIADALGIK